MTKERFSRKAGAFSVAMLLALIAGVGTGAIFLHRDLFFPAPRMESAGELLLEPDVTLLANAEAYAEKRIREKEAVCVSRFLGSDDRFVYLAMGCAKFTQQYGAWKAYGDQGFRALRLRHFFKRIIFGMDQADPAHLGESLRRMYPPAMVERWWKDSSPLDYVKAGEAKTQNP